MNNLQYIVKDNTRFAQHMAVELCEQGDFDSVSEAFRWLMQEREAATLGDDECELEIKDNMNELEGTGVVWWECSSCHWQIEFFHTKWLKNAKFCPQCGTRIREMKR